MQDITRRKALGTAAGIAVAGSLSTPDPARAIAPIARTGKSVLKLSLAAYSMRQYLTAQPGTRGAMNLEGFVDYCASLGLGGTELTAYYFPKDITPEYLNSLKRRARRAGLDISGGAIGNDFCLPAGPRLEEQLQQTKRWIDHYADLGANCIRVFAGNPPAGENTQAAIGRCIKTMEQACEMAGRRGVILALENHGGPTNRPESMLQIVKAVDSPWFGVNLDTGNFQEGLDPYAELAQIAPYAVNVQVKIEVARRRKAEPANYATLVELLRKAGYSGWVALEYEGREDPYKAIPKHLDKLRGAIAA